MRVSALPHHAESGNHPAPQVQRLRVFVHRNPLQGFSSPALRLYRVLGESGTDARLHPYRSRTAVDCPDGRSATFARLRPMGFFVHGWSWSSALELRAENDGKYNITPTRIYPRQRLIPELRRSGYGKQLPDVTPFDLIHLLLSENKAETLLKAGQTALVRFSPVPPAISQTICRPSVSPSVTGTLSGNRRNGATTSTCCDFRERPA